MTALWMLPVYFGLIMFAVVQFENWLLRRDRRARREGRRDALRWQQTRGRSPW